MTIAEFIPIFIIISLLWYSRSFINMSYSVLGKLIAIGIVLFYTHLDKYLGLVVCLLVIIYYQSDYVENMLNTNDIMDKLFENFEESKKNVSTNTVNGLTKIQDGDKKTSKLQENMSILTDVYVDNKKDEEVKEDDNPSTVEGMTTIDDFRKKNCKRNQLMFKDMKVNQDMSRHVFPSIDFKNGPCNVCDDTCEFSILENRLKTEKELFSKFSRDEENINEPLSKECTQCK